MAEDDGGLDAYEERFLQGVFGRVWRYLESNSNPDVPVRVPSTPDELRRKIDLAVGREGVDVERLLQDVDDYLLYSVRTSHTNFLNPLWGGTNIPAFAGEVLTSLTNTSMYTFEIAPMATLVEDEMIRVMNSLVGFEAGEGVFTTGGSNGNLMGMMCARDRKCPDSNHAGVRDKRLVAFVSKEGHYSAKMAANVLGIGVDNLIGIDCDDEGRMDIEALANSIAAEKRAGNLPFCVLATAGTTVAGAIDPLEDIADICKREYLWLHVDASWGGAALLSSKTRHLLRGIEKSDSVCWDPHKMMGMPIVCSVFLVKDTGVLRKVCSHTEEAHYLLYDGASEVDLGRKSLQCARRVDALKLWLAWRAKGSEGWSKQIEEYFELANRLADQIRSNPRLEIAIEPSLTNICIYYTRPGMSKEEENRITAGIRTKLLNDGNFIVTLSNVGDRVIMRPVIANPAVTNESLSTFLEEVVSIGDSL